jgi:hypothetical protein
MPISFPAGSLVPHRDAALNRVLGDANPLGIATKKNILLEIEVKNLPTFRNQLCSAIA